MPAIGRTAWLVLGLNTLSCLGSGLTRPFLIVYLHAVRGIDLATSGVLLGSIGVAGLATMPVAGILIDRIGPFKTFAVGQVIGGVGTAAFVLAASPISALAACVLLGMSGGITTNGLSSLLAVIVPPGQRGAVFGLGYTTYNVGIGLGALTAGFVVVAGSPHAYAIVFLADGVSFLLFAVALVMLESRAPRVARDRAVATVGYRKVLSDRALLASFLLNTLFWTAALSQSTVAFPAWATGPAGSSTTVVGVAFAVNTAVIALSQLFVIRWLRGRKRTTGAAAAGIAFGVSWLLLLTTWHGGSHLAMVLVLMLAVFALGEALLAPTLPALINDLAPDHLRGRYNAVFNLSTQIGQIVGPALAGLLLGGAAFALPVVLSLACLSTAVLAVAVRRAVPLRADVGATN
ncbi:MFS transporter [Kutzneria sp. NPDC052558]|uniref:MFS transporter n=1 Tax=Kutzneria sp. NPDC052558 TaxID=3364121 RepID=UPI0037C9D435